MASDKIVQRHHWHLVNNPNAPKEYYKSGDTIYRCCWCEWKAKVREHHKGAVLFVRAIKWRYVKTADVNYPPEEECIMRTGTGGVRRCLEWD